MSSAHASGPAASSGGAKPDAHGKSGGHDAKGGKSGHDAHGGGHGAPGAGHGAGAGGHAAHGGGHGGGHKKHKHEEHAHHGPPPWLISFGDMMTLFLCFFIVLVTMAPVRDAGLMADGLGSFVSNSFETGRDGALAGEERLAAVNIYRKRFGLTPLEKITDESSAPQEFDAQAVEDLLAQSLRPHSEIRQPLVARFAPGSFELDDKARNYLDLLADTLRPSRGQVLVLEGYARDVDDAPWGTRARLASTRARAVRRYLLDEHQLISTRVEARALADDGAVNPAEATGVDARLISSDS
jgi:flagellar motor protein MotB